MINQDDLITKDGDKIIHLRFKNCTGNVIILNKEPIEDVNQSEELTSKLALSIDWQFKNQRHRTVNQSVDMVLRWRTIAMGYFDY